MKRTLAVVTVFLLTLSLGSLMAETWTNVSIVDQNCQSRVAENPDAHKKGCVLKCADSGLGILTAEGDFLKFDASGNEKAVAALKATDKEDNLRVSVEGERDGDTIRVESITVQ